MGDLRVLIIEGLRVGDVFKLQGDELLNVIKTKRRFVLNVWGLEWNAAEKPSSRARQLGRRLLPLTLSGGPLTDLRPKLTTLYRGGVVNPGKVEGWSTSLKVARGFGPPVAMIELTDAMAAIDLTRAIGKSEDEVVIVSPDTSRAVHV
jgi:hypothetical protein